MRKEGGLRNPAGTRPAGLFAVGTADELSHGRDSKGKQDNCCR
jgi:hypothetical protein